MSDSKMSDSRKNVKIDENHKPKSQPSATLVAIPGDDNDYGSLRISESVFAALVRKYTLEVDGVVRFASGSLMGGLAEMFSRRSSESSIVVKFDGDVVNIAVTLVIRFGAKIPEVSELVQSVIRKRIEEFTGNHVAKVDVIIQDIEEDSEEEEENGEEGSGQKKEAAERE